MMEVKMWIYTWLITNFYKKKEKILQNGKDTF